MWRWDVFSGDYSNVSDKTFELDERKIHWEFSRVGAMEKRNGETFHGRFSWFWWFSFYDKRMVRSHHKSQYLAVEWQWLLPRRGKLGGQTDFDHLVHKSMVVALIWAMKPQCCVIYINLTEKCSSTKKLTFISVRRWHRRRCGTPIRMRR